MSRILVIPKEWLARVDVPHGDEVHGLHLNDAHVPGVTHVHHRGKEVVGAFGGVVRAEPRRVHVLAGGLTGVQRTSPDLAAGLVSELSDGNGAVNSWATKSDKEQTDFD